VADKKDRWLRNGIVLAFISAAVTAVFVPSVLKWLWELLLSLWRLLTSTVGIPVWLLSLTVALLLALLYQAAKRAMKTLAASAPSFLAYREDIIFGIHWRWSYVGNTLDEPHEFCPDCDTRLLFRDEYGMPPGLVTRNFNLQTVFFCEHCGWQSQPLDGEHHDIINRVMRQIDRRARSGEWQSTLQKKR